jgi:hypothetical protein
VRRLSTGLCEYSWKLVGIQKSREGVFICRHRAPWGNTQKWAPLKAGQLRVWRRGWWANQRYTESAKAGPAALVEKEQKKWWLTAKVKLWSRRSCWLFRFLPGHYILKLVPKAQNRYVEEFPLRPNQIYKPGIFDFLTSEPQVNLDFSRTQPCPINIVKLIAKPNIRAIISYLPGSGSNRARAFP